MTRGVGGCSHWLAYTYERSLGFGIRRGSWLGSCASVEPLRECRVAARHREADGQAPCGFRRPASGPDPSGIRPGVGDKTSCRRGSCGRARFPTRRRPARPSAELHRAVRQAGRVFTHRDARHRLRVRPSDVAATGSRLPSAVPSPSDRRRDGVRAHTRASVRQPSSRRIRTTGLPR